MEARPGALGDFAGAAARRYPGSRTGRSGTSRISTRHLAPQWTRRNGPLVRRPPLSSTGGCSTPSYAALKGVNAGATRSSLAGNAPYGDPPGGSRTRPRDLLEGRASSRPTSFDIFAHHPYSTRGPATPRPEPQRHLRARRRRLTRAGPVGRETWPRAPRKPKPLWITELGWDSSPLIRTACRKRHAAWLADAFYILWRQRAAKIVWTFVRDQAPTGGYDVTYQSGVFLLSGTPKLAQRRSPSRLHASARARQAARLGQGAGTRPRRDRARQEDGPPRDSRAATRVPDNGYR